MTVTISSLREKRHSLSPRIRSHSLSPLFTRKDTDSTPNKTTNQHLRPLYIRTDTCDRLEVHHPSPTDVEFERKEARLHLSSPTSSPMMDSPSKGRQSEKERVHEQLWERAAGSPYLPTFGRQKMHEQLWNGTLERGLFPSTTHSKPPEHHWTHTSSTHQSPTSSPLDCQSRWDKTYAHHAPSPLSHHTQSPTHWPRFMGPDGRIYQVVPEEEKPRGRMPGRGYATVGPRDTPSRGNGVRFMGNDGRVYHVIPEGKRKGRRGEMPGMWVE